MKWPVRRDLRTKNVCFKKLLTKQPLLCFGNKALVRLGLCVTP